MLEQFVLYINSLFSIHIKKTTDSKFNTHIHKIKYETSSCVYMHKFFDSVLDKMKASNYLCNQIIVLCINDQIYNNLTITSILDRNTIGRCYVVLFNSSDHANAILYTIDWNKPDKSIIATDLNSIIDMSTVNNYIKEIDRCIDEHNSYKIYANMPYEFNKYKFSKHTILKIDIKLKKL